MIRKGRKTYNAFTLVELVIVLVVLAILVSVALPNFSVFLERGRQSEGVTFLSQVHGSQLRYYYERDYVWPALATNLDLDVDMSSLKYFITLTLNATSGSATLARKTGSAWTYNLSINQNGNFSYASGVGPGGLPK